MISSIHPWSAPPGTPGTAVTTAVFPQTDQYTDVGLNSQYQYQGSNYWITLRGSYIHEYQKLNASYANGLSAIPATSSMKLAPMPRSPMATTIGSC